MHATAPYLVRQLQPSDAESFLTAVRESINDLTYWMPWCKPDYSIQDAREWISYACNAWETGKEYPLGVFDAQTGQVIGGTGVNHIDRLNRIGNIGYWVSSCHTGRGVARFAGRESSALAFGQLGLSRLEIVVLTHNLASKRVAEAIGATYECEARNRLYFQGEPHNAYVYSLVPADLSDA